MSTPYADLQIGQLAYDLRIEVTLDKQAVCDKVTLHVGDNSHKIDSHTLEKLIADLECVQEFIK